jgi:hypothetical protein
MELERTDGNEEDKWNYIEKTDGTREDSGNQGGQRKPCSVDRKKPCRVDRRNHAGWTEETMQGGQQG